MITVLVVLMAGAIFAVFSIWQRNDEWHDISSAFAADIDRLCLNLNPGDIAKVTIRTKNATELVLMPEYCDETSVKRLLAGRSPELVAEMSKIARNNNWSDVLIWIRGDKIVSVREVQFKAGLQLSLQSWKFREHCEIRVRKELQSANSFLSLYFLNEDEKGDKQGLDELKGTNLKERESNPGMKTGAGNENRGGE